MKLTRIQTIFKQRRRWVLALIILLPLLTILLVQYRSLRALEQTMPVYRRELLLTYLRAVTFDVMRTYRSNAERILAVPGGASSKATSRARKQAILASAADHFHNQQFEGARRFFIALVDEAQSEYEIFFYDPARRSLETDPKAPELRAINVAGGPYLIYLRQGARIEPNAFGNEQDPAASLILKPLLDDRERFIGLAGMTLDHEWFSREAVPTTAKRTLPRYFPGETDEATVNLCCIDGRSLWSTHGVVTEKPEATQRFSPYHTRYILGASLRNLSVEQWAQRNFLFNLSLSVVMMLVLVGGLVFGWRAAAEEIRLSRMKTDLVANVSHELRTPLTSICALAEMLKYDRVKDWEKVREYGDHINAQGRRLTQLVNNILDFSRIESGQREYRFARADLRAVVNEAMEAVALRLKQSGHTVQLEMPSSLPALQLDPDALALALSNLLDNAIKYSARGTEITVRVARDGDRLLVSIIDQGPGIERGEQEKIFEKFYRVGTGMVHDVKGTGLGLAIVKHIVEAHQGRIAVESEPGCGSTFTIHLPVVEERTSGKE